MEFDALHISPACGVRSGTLTARDSAGFADNRVKRVGYVTVDWVKVDVSIDVTRRTIEMIPGDLEARSISKRKLPTGL